MRQRSTIFFFCFVLVFQLVSGGRLAHLEASGTPSLCFGHHFSYVLGTLGIAQDHEAEPKAQDDACPCGHHDHTSLDDQHDKPGQDKSGHDHTQCTRAVGDFAAATGMVIEIDFAQAIAPQASWPTLQAATPKIASAAIAVRAPPRALASPPPDAGPFWLINCSLRN